MNSRELVALGLPQERVSVAFDALKASGLIAQPTEVMQRNCELDGAEQVCRRPFRHFVQVRARGPHSA